MPPEIASPPFGQFSRTGSPGVPADWRIHLTLLGMATLLLGLMAAREWGEMFHQWWNIDTYTHILLVPPIIGWLVWLRRSELARISPQTWPPGLAIVAAGLAIWLLGRVTGINLVSHAGAVGAIQGAVIAILGPRISLLIALPLCFGVFLVPFGDEMIPALQAVTAEIAVALTHWSGIPAIVDGIFIDTPVGLFIVAEACSGVKFLVAMVTLAVLVCFTRFESWARRAAFLAASIVIPIIANGVRAWGTIFIAQSQGVEFAAGFDHIFYGWIFFALVVAMLIGLAWRFFERESEDHGWTVDDLRGWSWLEAIDSRPATLGAMGGAIAALALAFALFAAIVAPTAIG